MIRSGAQNSMKKISIEGLLSGASIFIGLADHQIGLSGIKIFNTMYLLPILIAQDILGFYGGAICLLSSSLIRGIFFSKSGLIGFLIRISFIVYMIFRKGRSEKRLKIVASDIIGVIATLIVQFPLLCFFYRSSFGVENGFLILYSTIEDIFKLSLVVVCSRLINVKKFKEFYN